jgi:hypothetical protein
MNPFRMRTLRDFWLYDMESVDFRSEKVKMFKSLQEIYAMRAVLALLEQENLISETDIKNTIKEP